jgi:hypothetical protein
MYIHAHAYTNKLSTIFWSLEERAVDSVKTETCAAVEVWPEYDPRHSAKVDAANCEINLYEDSLLDPSEHVKQKH